MKIIFVIILIILIIEIWKYTTHKEESFNNSTNSTNQIVEYHLPRTIFAYWDNLNQNKLAQAYLSTWSNFKNFDIIVITKDNLNNHIKSGLIEQDFVDKYFGLESFRFSDFLRLYLLLNHGGTWIDLSTIIVDGNFLNSYYEEMLLNKYDATIFEFKARSTPNFPYLENWFLIAPRFSPFIEQLYKEFQFAYDQTFLKYKVTYLIPSLDLSQTLGYGDKIYLMQHAIIHYLLSRNNTYNLNIKDAEESMFKIQQLYGWEGDGMVNFILTNKLTNYYAIKMVSKNRSSLTKEKELQFIKKLTSIGSR